MKKIVTTISLSFCLLTAKAQTVNFNGSNVFPTSASAYDVVVGDFNEDGLQDLVTCHAASGGKIAIALGSSGGTFATAVLYNSGAGSSYIKKNDVNEDSHLDLVVVNSTSSVSTSGISVLIGDGTGTFAAPVFYATGIDAADPAFGDFNEDGNIDIIVPNEGPETVSLLLGSGTGTFTAAVNFSTSYNPLGVDTADFNEDGNLDIAVASNHGFDLLLGNGAGSFGTYAYTPVDFSSNWSYAIETGDFEKDGNMDVMVAGPYGLVYNKGKGNGTFFSYVYTPVPYGVTEVRATDLDNDGFLDIVCASGDILFRHLNKGDGTLDAGLLYSPGNAMSGIDIADLTADGLEDVAIANSGGGAVTIVTGKADGTLKGAPIFHSIYEGNTVATADFNGDDNKDIVYATGGGYYIFTGTGNGTFSDTSYVSVNLATSGAVTGDFNGDGFSDFALSRSEHNMISVFINTGTGTFNTGVTYSTGTSSYPYSIACGYLDSDGYLDLVTANSKFTGTVSIFYGNGNGTFDAAVDLAAGTNPHDVLIRDVNEDGKNDIVLSNSSGISVIINNGSGFNTRVSYTASDVYGIVAADFDGDNHLDLIAAKRNVSGALYFMKGNGVGAFAAPVQYATGSFPQAVATGYFNQDNYLDAVIYSDQAVTFFTNNGSGIFTLAGKLAGGNRAPDYENPSKYPTQLATADFNEDGNTDVLTANTSWGGMSLLMNLNSPSLAVEPSALSSGLTFNPVATTGLTLSWTNGDGTNRIVLIKAGSPVDQFPVDGTTYTANTTFASGTELGSGNYVVYNGSGNSISITGLTPGTVYYIAILESNGSGVTTNYLTSTYSQADVTTTSVTSINKSSASSDFKVYPNPISSGMQLQVSYSYKGEVSMAISDLLGNELQTVTGMDHENIQIATSGLLPGIYFYKLYLEKEEIVSGKLIVY